MKDKNELVKNKNGEVFNKESFMIEESHPAIGRILIVDDRKYKILDDPMLGPHKSGTFIKLLTEEDEETMAEYDRDLEALSEKLVNKVDIKRLIKEHIKNKPLQELKTGLFILKQEENGEDIEEEHHRGCYHFKMYHKNQTFEFAGGDDLLNLREM